MIRNIFTTSIRNLSKNGIYTFINVSGLAIGVAATIFILIYVNHELGYDRQFDSEGKMYRLIRNFDQETGSRDVGITSAPFAPALMTDFPGRIKNTLRVMPVSALVSYEEKAFMESSVYLADSTFVKFFPFELIEGSMEHALEGNSILLSSDMATKYFGDESPVNKTLELDDQFLYTVTGVFDKTQIQSHLEFDFLATLNYQKNYNYFRDWWSNSFSTYFMLEEGIDIEEISSGLPAFTEKYFGEDWKQGIGKGLSLKAEPLKDIYFNNETTFDFVQHGNIKIVYLFAAVAGLVLLIAVFNFVNLSTALSVSRQVEIGIRKASGAGRHQIIGQFLFESIMLTFMATLISFLMLEVLYPWFISVVGKPIVNPLNVYTMLALIISVSSGVGILGGFYPALILSAFSPKRALISKKGSGPQGQILRKGMVTLQFTFSIFLIFATWISWDQLQFIQNKDLGFNYDNVLYFPINNSDFYNSRHLFKERVSLQSGVSSVTYASGEPGGFHDFNAFRAEGHEGNLSMRSVKTDYDYLKVMKLELIAGRDFSRDFRTDSLEAVIINREAATFLGWEPEEALGKTIRNARRDRVDRRIVGVVKDYHFRSLHEKIDPLVINIDRDHRVAIIRFETTDLENLLSGLRKEWDTNVSAFPFAYNFLDDRIEELYDNEKSQSRLFLIFCSLALVIACMGLFALSMISASRRVKEMAIRKVHGAGVLQIVKMLNSEFLLLVIAGTVLMVPFGWYIMNKWLQNFEYRIDISLLYYLGTAILVAIISIVTVSHKAFSVAKINPARTLRHE